MLHPDSIDFSDAYEREDAVLALDLDAARALATGYPVRPSR